MTHFLPPETASQLRLECLCEAVKANSGSPKQIVDAARMFSDFVLGTNDGEIIAAARALAEKVK